MNRKHTIAVVFVGLIFLTLGGAECWGQLPASNDKSDAYYNTGGGYLALTNNTTGSQNTAYGDVALNHNTTGADNTALGAYALSNNHSGSYNTATGWVALIGNNSTYNTANGAFALDNNLYGVANTALGAYALHYNGGSHNTALGVDAGFYATGSNNIYLANYGVAGESNTMRLGQTVANGSQTQRTFIGGIAGVPVTGSQVLINSQGQLGVLASSARYKRDIQDMGESTQRLMKLRPVTFRYKEDPEAALQYGLIAEEVAKVYPELVVRGTNGEVESVQYHQIISMLLNEVQHQQKALNQQSQQITTQSQQIAELKAQNEEQHSHNAALETRLERLEKQAAHTGMLAATYERSF
jgi:polyhydroxyalkanoate synthesis regulator phasin